jgi:hypothetical protein
MSFFIFILSSHMSSFLLIFLFASNFILYSSLLIILSPFNSSFPYIISLSRPFKCVCLQHKFVILNLKFLPRRPFFRFNMPFGLYYDVMYDAGIKSFAILIY